MIFTLTKEQKEKLSALKGQELFLMNAYSTGMTSGYSSQGLVNYSFGKEIHLFFRAVNREITQLAVYITYFEYSIYNDICFIKGLGSRKIKDTDEYLEELNNLQKKHTGKHGTFINMHETIQAIDVYGVSTILNLEEHDLGITTQSPNVPIELDLLLLFHCESGNKIAVHGTQVHGLMSVTVYFKDNTAALYEWMEYKTNMMGLPYYRKKYSL